MELHKRKRTAARVLLGIMLAVCMFVFCGAAKADTPVPEHAEEQETAVPQAEDYAKKRIAVMTGSTFPDIVSARFPEAEQVFYNTVADMHAALEADKVDALALDEPVARNLMAERGGVTIAEGYLDTFDFACLFPKTKEGQERCDELSDFIRRIREDGTMEKLQKKWFDSIPEESMMAMNPSALPGTNGTLTVATLTYAPFTIQGQESFFGYEAELLGLFGQEAGYRLLFTEMSTDAVIPAVQSGKADMGAFGASITAERQEVMLFAEPDYSGGVILVVRDPAASGGGSFFQRIKESFEKTFVRENRYLMFLSGIVTTVLITALSIVFGTLLGFLLFLSCRRGNVFANRFAKCYSWLMTGMPMVVLLMILYYIVFGKSSIGGTAVSIIGFTLVFCAEVFGMMTAANGTVDSGQMEAAYALGYTDHKAFFRFILPQAMPHFMPGYRSSLVSLIKSTSIVGYVAVQDLTKIGDIVRSRTYEAFFPLIAIAVIYFVLAGILVLLVDRVTQRLDPTRRKNEEILKGVVSNR